MPTSPSSFVRPEPSIRGNLWPTVVKAPAARMMALLFQLEQSQWLSPERIREQQFIQLDVLLRHAYETSPFYRQRLDQAGINLSAGLRQDDWSRIPLLTREDWQIAGPTIYSSDCPAEHGAKGQLFTSGSTGKPVMVLTTGLTQLIWNTFTVRDHLWHRRDFAGKLGAIRFVSGGACDPPAGRTGPNWGPATAAVSQTGPSATLHIKAGIDEQIPWLRTHQPNYLITYPSNIYALARKLEQTGGSIEGLKEVRTFGEILEPHVRETVRRVLGVRVVDMYSSQEVGYIALQCPDHDHYHVQSENVLVEVLDESGQPTPPGEIGRVVVTALHNFATPIIRYRIGDFAEVGPPCPCGRGLTVLNRIVGRQRNMLVLPNGDMRWPSIEVDDAAGSGAELPPIQQFQVIQRTLEDIEALLVCPRELTEDEKQMLINWFERSFGWSFRVKFTYVDHIPTSPTGKFEDFRSDVAVQQPGNSPSA